MTTHIDSARSPVSPAAGITRPPATVIVATVLTVIVAAVGTYGAVFFSGLDGYDSLELTFLAMYGYLSLIGIASAIAQVRRSAVARAGVVAWAVFMVLFAVIKVITIQETEAIPFGVVALVVVALQFTPPTRRFVAERR